MNKYIESYTAKINKNCVLEFNKTSSGEVHISISTFGQKSVNLSEDTLSAILATFEQFKKDEANRANSSSS